MKLERQSILGETITGYRVVNGAPNFHAPEQAKLPEVLSNTPTDDVARVILRRLEEESTKVARDLSSTV